MTLLAHHVISRPCFNQVASGVKRIVEPNTTSKGRPQYAERPGVRRKPPLAYHIAIKATKHGCRSPLWRPFFELIGNPALLERRGEDTVSTAAK